MNHKSVQAIAKDTMAHLARFITTGMTVQDVITEAERHMHSSGIESFWYYDIGTFVFSGEDTALSLSGRDYTPSSRKIEANDIITIDLSPQVSNTWGDFARTLIVEEGIVKTAPETIKNTELREGLETELALHHRLIEVANPDMTFDELYRTMNAHIAELGYVNLDFGGNLGHSIEANRDDRRYIKRGNNTALSSARYFTFEPHIQKPPSKFGFKREDIYFFKNSQLTAL